MKKMKMKPLIPKPLELGLTLIFFGLITGGTGGILVFIGGIFYMISNSK